MCEYSYPYGPHGTCNVNGPWWCCGRDQDNQLIPCDDCDEPLCGYCVDRWKCINALGQGLKKAKEVIKKIVNTANFTVNGSRGAFMEFDDTPRDPTITFDDIASVDQFNKIIDDVDCDGGTEIIPALNHSLSKVFNYPNGIRDNTEKVALLITDGRDGNEKELYVEMGEKFKEQDITLMVIAVGRIIEEEKLIELVQSPSYLFKANDWDVLDDRLIKAITAAICDGKKH